MMNIQLIDKNNLEFAIWPQTKEGIFAKKYLVPILKNGTLKYVDNLDVFLKVLIFNDTVFPIIISNPNQKVKNSYVCSPMSHYIGYGHAEADLELSEQKVLKKITHIFLNFLEPYLKKRDFEKAVFVNNWLLSTNLYPKFDLSNLKEIRDFLIKEFPDYPILFKSINDMFNLNIKRELEKLDFHSIISRQVYILDPKKEIYKKKDSYKKDLKAKRRTEYYWEDADKITKKDYSRIRYLYEDLYIKKYCYLNPTFTEDYFEETLKNNLLTYKVLKKEGVIYAVFGYIECQGVITAPIFGYDTSLPEKDGLYRLTALKILEDAIEKEYIVHQSSGVSKFKMHRGAESSIEYMMVYYSHLSKRQQQPWKFFNKLSDKVVIPIMKKYQL